MWSLERIRDGMLVAVVMLAVNTKDAFAQQDFFAQLIPPDLIMEHRVEIDLSIEQYQQIAAITDEFGTRVETLRNDADEQNRKLKELLSATPINEATVLECLDEFLTAENKMKQCHVTAMIRVRSVLTERQRAILVARLRDMRESQLQEDSHPRSSVNEIEQRLRRKVLQIKREVESRASRGTHHLEAEKNMKVYSQVIEDGRVQESEAILDRVMEMLDIQPDAKAAGQNRGEQSSVLQQPPASIHRLTPQPALSYSELKRRVSDLRVEDVAWRKIEWETCLLRGLRRSRSQSKPLVLWVFIDRPIDDERC